MVTLCKNGDRIIINADDHSIDLEHTNEELEKRCKKVENSGTYVQQRSFEEVCEAGFNSKFGVCDGFVRREK